MRELRMMHEVKVEYKPTYNQENLTKLSSCADACSFLRDIWEDDILYRERFYMLMLNQANKVIGFTLIGIGGSSSVSIDIKMIMQSAILTHSQGIVLAHNHPSGNLTPSEADIRITKRLNEACKVMDIKLIDHIILTENNYYSFAESGIL
jgi:DNA repair protein RadC